ncbi:MULTISPECIES: aldehyde dehydrogenase family protein [unclassified Clostridium]|uniref:aldehyde dehydrogenase family protein n=1 Tax=unclassified Clostridium TaxID=2614128 RepID=UPI00029767D1|nr:MULTISPECIES: aldehyde dehydrogenase family protein [unclassified Clostridium]EKQ54844.1 MAG: NAD-dependent aldehyde dehydrogenase [Clostridium sp. Maddingley MBC34-26]
MENLMKMYIDGEWVTSISGETREIINPANGDIIGICTEGDERDVKEAVKAAKRAFYEDGWMDTTPDVRAALLLKTADLLEKRSEEFALIETINNGKTLDESRYDISDSVHCLRYYAGIINKPSGQTFYVEDNVQTMVIREPIGVCGQIVPWNFPLLMAVWKLAPALAAGNTVIFKPAEITPMSVIKLFEIFHEVGIPKGVVNIVLGSGSKVGQEIASNMDIDKIAFTGGTSTGRKIMSSAAANIKNISLELGGKSPNIIFADADMELALDYALYGIFLNQGQVCAAGSRLLLEDSIYDEFIEKLKQRATKIKVGNGIDRDTKMGLLISRDHMEKVLSYIEIGINEGARLVCGGHRIVDNGMDKGFFIEPTIFADTTPDMRIVKEEIFGPVLVIQKFSDEKDSIRLANDSEYGLAGAVFTKDITKAMRVIKKLRAGITWVNNYQPAYCEAPWGGYKQSGIGRELGTIGYEEYTEVKQISINLAPKPNYWF